MRISQLAERTGTPATTLRFYETAGPLPAERTPASYRIWIMLSAWAVTSGVSAESLETFRVLLP
ncbi:MerR family DNA-binding transcriptional regulator [Saccharopolyspora sp. NPDC049426]|uniref:MerR family DNA-binding transcriptional regulator n=1 Tax=Saccharopolyspora sp. NPDC049426 TaxID=3155652 RepID=UPI00343C077C